VLFARAERASFKNRRESLGVNWDVPSRGNPTDGFTAMHLLNSHVLIVYKKGGEAGHIYTWNNSDTQQRGPGGEPTTPCNSTE
jgi:hypothetical protein